VAYTREEGDSGKGEELITMKVVNPEVDTKPFALGCGIG